MRLLAHLAVVAAVLGCASVTTAHPLAPSVLSFEQTNDGRVKMCWRAPVKRPTGQSLRPRIPEACTPLGPATLERAEDGAAITETVTLRCEPPDMLGAVVRVDGFEDSSVNVVVRIVGADGRAHHAILDAGTPSFTLQTPEERSHSFLEYLMLGVEHLLTGWDHMTFLIGLLVLFGWRRRLIAAVTAFTIGHSITLALSVLRIIAVPQMLVEALIAWTIVILALEIYSGRRGPVWKHPWMLPGALGLLHGLGFASVLFEAGLPADEVPLALFGFNLGLEVGQLGFIAVAWLCFKAIRSALPLDWKGKRAIPAYVIGSLAAFWVIERTLAMFGVVV
jgi:hydrogenase/urease accessory protein HupE